MAEVADRAAQCEGPSEVVLPDDVLDDLRRSFDAEFEHARRRVWAAAAVQIDVINVAGEMPRAGAASFHVEVVRVYVEGHHDRTALAALLTTATMDAVAEFLIDWEVSPQPAT